MAALLDTNLLVLFVVGCADESLIARHKRLSQYSKDDFEYLRDYLAQHNMITTTPHVLAETSNFLLDTPHDSREIVMEYFKVFMTGLTEQHVPAVDLSHANAFSRLGVADAGLLDAQFSGCVLLTNDGSLHTEALTLGHAAIHFNELREFQL